MTEKGLKFLMAHEGYRKDAYWDKTGKVWTIGYGNTYWPDGRKVQKGDTLQSQEQALEMLKLVVPKYEASVRTYVSPDVYDTLTDNQKDALTSLTYNIGSGNFKTSTVCKRVKTNKDDRTIKDAFNMWNKSGGEVLKGLVRRRAEEGALYFNEPVDIPDIPISKTTSSATAPVIEKPVYDSSYGTNNMFYEVSHSSDWVVTKFKIIPSKKNNWKTLLTVASRPKVGDLLFAYHDAKISGVHDHVAIYLGVHEGHIYVAEGLSVSGSSINETDKKVHISKIEDSRLGYDTDVITHFAHCVKKEIQQTQSKTGNVGLDNKTGSNINVEYEYKPAKGEDKMKHFTLIDDSAHKYKAGQSSLLWSDKAHAKGIQNTPTPEARQNLVNLVNNLLDPVYEMVEKKGIGKIFVSSGYRNQEVNSAIGGASKSQHMSGQAVDIQIRETGGTMGEALLAVAKVILNAEDKLGLSYDQMILEKFNTDVDKAALRPVWIHISYKDNNRNRKYSDTTKLMMWNSSTGKYKSLTKSDVISKHTRWDD